MTEPDMSHAFDDVDDGGPEVPDESGPDAGEDEEDTDTDREATAMAKNMRRATDESGTVTDALTADEVLNDVVDQGIDFQPAQDKNATEPNSTSAEVGDNYEGSQKTYDDADDETLKPVATASAMRLADAYIRAGVLRESDRYAAIEGFAKLPKIAAEHELKALDLVRKANAKRTAALRRAALEDRFQSVRCASADAAPVNSSVPAGTSWSSVNSSGFICARESNVTPVVSTMLWTVSPSTAV